MPITRFVILHHRERSGEPENLVEHWDLMIEQADSLATWRMARLPRAGERDPIPATRIGDHRKAYLTYEGPLTKDRGEVARVEEGACEILEATVKHWRFHLMGNELAGDFELRDDGAGWSFCPA